MNRKNRFAVVAAASTGLLCLGQNAVLAAEVETEDVGIGEIIVTAQKRSEKQVDVPISMTTVSDQGLKAAGVIDMASLNQVIPGLKIDQTDAFFQPSIRGVGTAVAGQGVSPSVATYLDGIYQPNPLANNFNFVDVDNIEVLKGPQGTLFGRNTTAGAILVTTRGPSFDTEYAGNVSYGSWNTASVNGFVAGELTSAVAGSLAAGYTRSDGWVTNLADGSHAGQSETYTVRGKILYVASENLKFTLTLDSERTNDPSGFAAGTYNGYTSATGFFGVPNLSNDRRQIDIQPGTYEHVSVGYGAVLKSELTLDFANLTSYSSAHWNSGKEAANEAAGLFPANGTLPVQPCPTLNTCSYLATGGYSYLDFVSWRDGENTYSQELDLNSKPGGPIDWVTGLYWFYDESTYSPETLGIYGPFGAGGALSGALPPWPASSYQHTPFQYINQAGAYSQSAAAFADATYHWNNFHFDVGGRFAWDRPSVVFSAPANLADGFVDVPRESAAQNFYSFTPKAVVRYSITPNSNVYVSWSKGEKSGVYNSSGYNSEKAVIQPEKITDVEAGYKIATRNTNFAASIFHYDYEDLQVSTYENGIALIQNAPRSEMWGGDWQIQQHITDALRVDFGGAYTHARYLNFSDAAYQSYSVPNGVQNLSANVGGYPMERTPAIMANAALDFTQPLFGGVAEANLNYLYQTRVSFDFANTLVQGAYGVMSLRLSWTDPSGHWTGSVTGKNLLNKTYENQILPDSGGFGVTYGMPFGAFVELAYKH